MEYTINYAINYCIGQGGSQLAINLNNKIIIEGLSLLQSIPPTTADKQTLKPPPWMTLFVWLQPQNGCLHAHGDFRS